MPLLEVMRAELERRGLPRHYIDRACGELAAHLDESEFNLVQQGVHPDLARSIASERLGCPVALAYGLYWQQAANSICFRHPLCSTVGISLLVFFLLGAAQLATFAAFWRSLSPDVLDYSQTAAKTLLPLIGGAILRPLFARHTGQKRWLNLAISILITLSATSVVRLTPLTDDHAVATLRLVP